MRFASLSTYKQNGFTLVEVLVATVVLTMAFLGTLGLLVSNINNNRLASQMTEATTLAQDRIERIKNTAFANVTAASFPAEANIDENGAGGGIYSRTTTITNHVPPTGSQVRWKQATVTVTWTRDGTNHNVTLRTTLSE